MTSGTASSAGGNDGTASNGTSTGNSTGVAGAGNSTAGRRLLQDNTTSVSGSANGTAGLSGAPAFSTWTGADDGCVTRDEYNAMFGSDTSAPPFDSKAGLGDDNLKCISQADEDVWLQQKFCVQVRLSSPTWLFVKLSASSALRVRRAAGRPSALIILRSKD